MNGFFQEISRTNAAYCAARGLSAAELYGNPPNAAEVETHELIAAGVPAEAADPYMDRMRADDLRLRKVIVHQQRAARLRNARYAAGPFKRLANVERVVRAEVAA